MSKKKELNLEELDGVTGGKNYEPGYYFDLMYISPVIFGGKGFIKDGPFESSEIANTKLEEKKKELNANHYIVTSTKVYEIG